ncbi:hypothetical protein Ddc_16708 [Ditylenchus destructor]|nr:hypothetical protein Ddc_16708 [Ditylenchus destructor]
MTDQTTPSLSPLRPFPIICLWFLFSSPSPSLYCLFISLFRPLWIVELPAVGEMWMPQQMQSKAKKEPIPEPNPSNQALKPTGRCEKVANPDTCASPEKGSSPDLCPAVQT